MHRFAIARLVAALLSCIVAASAMAQLVAVPGEPSLTPKEAARPVRMRLASATQVVLAPVSAAERSRVQSANARAQKRITIGVVRSANAAQALPAAGDVAWQAVEGGMAAQVAVTSPGAGAMRLALDLTSVAPQVEIVIAGSAQPERLVGPVRVASIASRSPWWTPITDGDTQTVEMFAPAGTDPQSLRLSVAAVSHLFTTLSSRLEKLTDDIGRAGSCNVDIQCSPLKSSQAFLNARNAVAQMSFVDGSGVVECTGTLLNDTDKSTQVPWFLTANHCFDNEDPPLRSDEEVRTIAATLTTLWFFEAQSCSVDTVPPYVQLSNGASLVYRNTGADTLLLRLNEPAPAGAYFAGWDPNPVPVGSQVIDVHHPWGDLKKISQGTVQRYSLPPVAGGATAQYSDVVWSSGTTEPGSSGSALLTFDGSNYFVRGTLWGGSADCSTPGGVDDFSRFDATFTAIAPYLAPAGDFTDMWWNPGESGWGINVIEHPSRNIFAVWFTYDSDGNRTWFVLPSGSWTSTSTYSGVLYRTSGPPASGAFNAGSVNAVAVGNASFTFSDANHGTFTYTVNGASGTKAIQRQSF